jgi:Bacterial RNA polymerase, alpha chain C terminal domain
MTETGDDLPKLSAPARRALASAGVKTLADVAALTEAELNKLHGLGPSTIVALRAAMAERGLEFQPKS